MDQFATPGLIRNDRAVRGWRDPHGRAAERLILRGQGWTSSPVPGRLIEAAFLTPDGGALVLTSDDCPYEEAIHVIWIGPDGTELGRADLGLPYLPGIIGNIELVPPDQVCFSFPGPETRWRVRPVLRGGMVGWVMRQAGHPRLELVRLS